MFGRGRRAGCFRFGAQSRSSNAGNDERLLRVCCYLEYDLVSDCKVRPSAWYGKTHPVQFFRAEQAFDAVGYEQRALVLGRASQAKQADVVSAVAEKKTGKQGVPRPRAFSGRRSAEGTAEGREVLVLVLALLFFLAAPPLLSPRRIEAGKKKGFLRSVFRVYCASFFFLIVAILVVLILGAKVFVVAIVEQLHDFFEILHIERGNVHLVRKQRTARCEARVIFSALREPVESERVLFERFEIEDLVNDPQFCFDVEPIHARASLSERFAVAVAVAAAAAVVDDDSAIPLGLSLEDLGNVIPDDSTFERLLPAILELKGAGFRGKPVNAANHVPRPLSFGRVCSVS